MDTKEIFNNFFVPPPLCPFCKSSDGQSRAGILPGTGSQRYRCTRCQRRYTLDKRTRGYSEPVRKTAMELHTAGVGVRAIARQLGVNPQTVANWLQQSSEEKRVSSKENNSQELAQNIVPPEEKRRVTITDVAKYARVSNSTVSNFLNDKGGMSNATRQRIQDAIDRLHFTPNALVRAIRHRKSGIVGVMLFGLDTLDKSVESSITPPLLTGINIAAVAAGYNLLIYPGWLYWSESRMGLPLLDGHIDGLLWIAPRGKEPALEQVAAAGLPTVVVLSRHVPPSVGYVNSDNFAAIHQALEHLYSLGHRRIAYYGPIHDSNFRDRHEGYRLALEQIGLPFDSELECIDPDFVWMHPALNRILDRWFTLMVPPTAIVLPDDGLAQWMIAALAQRGLRVPEDIAITGFNDLPYAERIGGGLTTIRQSFREMGRLAMERLLALIGGEPIETCQISVPTSLTVRKTTQSRSLNPLDT